MQVQQEINKWVIGRMETKKPQKTTAKLVSFPETLQHKNICGYECFAHGDEVESELLNNIHNPAYIHVCICMYIISMVSQ